MITGFLSRVEPPQQRRVPSGPRVAPSDAYTAAAFKGEIDNVLSAPEGVRNHTLFSATANLAEFVNAGTLDEPTVRDALTDAARDIGLEEFEIEATIKSGFDKVAGAARTVPEQSPVQSPQPASEGAPAPPPAAGNRLSLGDQLLTPTGLRTLPEPKPLIDNVLDQGTTALLYGKWGSSKSFIALDWACCVATGRSWQGRPTERARVLYVVGEGVAGFSSRLDAWEVGWRQKIEDGWLRFLPMPVNLMTREVDELIGLVNGGGYGMIVLDTLARCMVGGDENSAKDAGIVVDSLARLMYATPERRGVVLGVHHTGKDGKTLRGSSAFESGVDTVYFAERDRHAVSLRRTKRKDGPESDVHSLKLSQVEGSDSCVIESLSGENNGENDSDSVVRLKQIFSEMFSQTGVSNSELRNVADQEGISQASFYRARGELLKSGWIRNTGSGSRAFFEIAHQGEELF